MLIQSLTDNGILNCYYPSIAKKDRMNKLSSSKQITGMKKENQAPDWFITRGPEPVFAYLVGKQLQRCLPSIWKLFYLIIMKL
jgi:hypothetical protein